MKVMEPCIQRDYIAADSSHSGDVRFGLQLRLEKFGGARESSVQRLKLHSSETVRISRVRRTHVGFIADLGFFAGRKLTRRARPRGRTRAPHPRSGEGSTLPLRNSSPCRCVTLRLPPCWVFWHTYSQIS